MYIHPREENLTFFMKFRVESCMKRETIAEYENHLTEINRTVNLRLVKWLS
jgi:hypothetical protein